jgi:Na+/H+ antiporter NhaD/arsenite permease-like protein
MAKKLVLLHLLAAFLGGLGFLIGLTIHQSFIIFIFALSILGTLFFWDARLSFAFIGSGIFFLVRAVDMQTFIHYASLDVILFLIAMMIIVGMMKDAGLFTWLVTLILRMKRLSGIKMFIVIMFASAVFSSLMGEVTSIIVMATVILNISDFLDVDPLPLILSSVMATNIGSAATVLGNPVGVLITARGHLSFEDFIIHAMPISFAVLLLTIAILCVWYRKYIRTLTERIQPYNEDHGFLCLISIPPDIKTRISMIIFAVTIVLIGFHHRLEVLLNIEENALLIMLPIISAGIVMIYRRDKARYYIEHEVEWPSILFFMFLFAQAGVVQSSGIAGALIEKMLANTGDIGHWIFGIILFSSGILSSAVDNVITVASFVPLIKSLETYFANHGELWWALLFGACYGGNITMIGSTANIVALGLLEKERNIKITFFAWLKMGLVIGFATMTFALVLSYLM